MTFNPKRLMLLHGRGRCREEWIVRFSLARALMFGQESWWTSSIVKNDWQNFFFVQQVSPSRSEHVARQDNRSTVGLARSACAAF
jgi:hypothetical protein